MNALCKACKNFTAAENSDKIRRVLRHQVRTYAGSQYDNGDKVYFKRTDLRMEKTWCCDEKRWAASK